MLIRTKLLASHLIKLVSVMLVCFGIIAALIFSNQDRQQIKNSYEELRNINLAAIHANRMSEQIAELFILGGQEPDLVEARDALLARLDRQANLIREHERLPDDQATLPDEFRQIDEMKRIVTEIDQSRKVLGAHLAAGRTEEATRVYSDEFENRLDHQLGELLDQAMERQRMGVESALVSSERLTHRSIIMAVSLVVIVAALGITNVIIFERTIMSPIATLVTGANTVGRGDLEHMVSVRADDELGHLAARFNAMTRELKAQRDALLDAKANLSDKVEARTGELRDRTQELEEKNDRLRQVDASRANFFADISHELRTPLTILRGQAEVTLRDEDADPAELRDALEACVRNAEHMGRLVDDLLFLARSEAGSIMVARDEIVLQDVVDSVVLDSKGLSRRADITIKPSRPSGPLIVIGDSDRLHQAVLIVLDNAVKFAPRGSQVDVDLEAQADRAVIRVRDAGPGMTREELGCAFTRFYRGQASRPRSGRGLGLGLSIAKWIIDQHEGDIFIESEPEGGARVEISIPLARVAA
ncbi:ATP-binding protein [Roseovarius tibetensis]|uniref:sensor histidine kinase n=1 Tax=Roseovarius tibetensis TaxID=2685897 RepID=UPI003D7F2B55